MRQVVLLTAIGCGLVLACSAGDGNDDAADGSGGQGGDGELGDECEEPTDTPWELDEPVPEGFTPQEVLDIASGLRQGTLTWHGSGAGVEVEPASGETELTVEVRYTGGDVFYREYPEFCGNVPVLLITVDMDFATADGAFADTWTVVAAAIDEGVHVDLDLNEVDIQGTFSAVKETDDPDYFADVDLKASVTADSNTGAIEVAEGYDIYDPESGEGQGGVSEPHETATWTATPTGG